MFLTSLMHKLKNCYFTDGTNSTKAGMIDYLFENMPRYLLVDEIDNMYENETEKYMARRHKRFSIA